MFNNAVDVVINAILKNSMKFEYGIKIDDVECTEEKFIKNFDEYIYNVMMDNYKVFITSKDGKKVVLTKI